MENILILMLEQLNKTDCDKLVSKSINEYKNKDVSLIPFLEAMYLYNMYYDSFLEDSLMNLLYPYKLKRVIDIANNVFDKSGKIVFKQDNGHFRFSGSIQMKELENIIGVLIKYGDINYIVTLMKKAIPYIEKAGPSRNFYIALKLMEMNGCLPLKFGAYFTKDYFEMHKDKEYYKEMYDTILNVIALSRVPLKARAIYFSLKNLIKSLNENMIFDFGSVCLSCFKVIEISTKSLIITPLIEGIDKGKLYDLIPDNIKRGYSKEKFNIDRLELGKIYHLLDSLKNMNNLLSERLRSIFKTEANQASYQSYIHPLILSIYRNPAAHSEYLSYEKGMEAYKILNDYISKALPYFKGDFDTIEASDTVLNILKQSIN